MRAAGPAAFAQRQIVRARTGQALLDLRPLSVRHFTLPLVVLLIIPGSLLWLATVDETTSVAQTVVTHVVFSAGLAALFSPLMTTALGSLPKELYSRGSAILNNAQQLAAAAGTASLIAIYSVVSDRAADAGADQPTALADGSNSAFLVSGILVGIGLVLSLFISGPQGLQGRDREVGRLETCPYTRQVPSERPVRELRPPGASRPQPFEEPSP